MKFTAGVSKREGREADGLAGADEIAERIKRTIRRSLRKRAKNRQRSRQKCRCRWINSASTSRCCTEQLQQALSGTLLTKDKDQATSRRYKTDVDASVEARGRGNEATDGALTDLGRAFSKSKPR